MDGLYKVEVLDLDAQNTEVPLKITYQLFGQALYTAPIVLVHHALTGNSNVAGKNGWWNRLIGEGQTIDLYHYTVIAFNIPGNAYKTLEEDSEVYKGWTTQRVAKLFWKALDRLEIPKLFAIIGGSLGGAIAWEMAILRPMSIQNLIPIATSNQASDWLIANVLVQDKLLNTSEYPIENARMHAMLLYRTPESLTKKFEKQYKKEEAKFGVESWLEYHGKTLQQRFSLAAYKRMNYLLRSIGSEWSRSDFVDFAESTTAKIYCIAITSDYMFPIKEQENIYNQLKKYKTKVDFYTIDSIHGHDAFLIEYDQLNNLLNPIFKK